MEDGAGAGVTINAVAFLIIQENNIKLMPVCHSSSLDRLLDYVPDLMEKTNNKDINNAKEEVNNMKAENNNNVENNNVE